MYKFRFIYKTTNLLNGKIYVGQHSTNNLEDGYLGSGLIFRKAISKYGENQFSREIIEYAKTKQELNCLEINYISKLNSTSPIGYNLSPGGHIQTKEDRLKTSIIMKGNNYGIKNKGIIRSIEFKENLSKIKTGVKIGVRSNEIKLNISKGLIEGFYERTSCFIYDLKEGTVNEYKNINVASKEIKLDKEEIKASINKNILNFRYIITKIEFENFVGRSKMDNIIPYLFFIKKKKIIEISEILKIREKLILKRLANYSEFYKTKYEESLIKKENPLRYFRSEEQKIKISNSLKGKFIGESNPNFGNKWTKQSKRNLSKKLSGLSYNKGGNNHKSKKVKIYDLINEIHYYSEFISGVSNLGIGINSPSIWSINKFQYFIYPDNFTLDEAILLVNKGITVKIFSLINLYKLGYFEEKIISEKTGLSVTYIKRFIKNIKDERSIKS